MDSPRIVIVGAGNVATHLAKALNASIIVSRNFDNARALAAKLPRATAIASVSDIPIDTDYCIIAVNDDSIEAVASGLPEIRGIVAHTSGSVPITALDCVKGGKGVFYPLQTFSKATAVDMSQVPFFIEGDCDITFDRLSTLAGTVSGKVYKADSSQRASLHIAAVFGCNFVNHMLCISTNLLKSSGYPLDVLKPLVDETIRKAFAHGAFESQTGPAIRNDRNVLIKHIDSLPDGWDQIYRLISADIYYTHNFTDPEEYTKNI